MSARLGSRLVVSQALAHWACNIHLPDLSIPPFVPCRGRRRGGQGKSIKNPTQVRPSLSSTGGSFLGLHFTNSPALARKEGQGLQP